MKVAVLIAIFYISNVAQAADINYCEANALKTYREYRSSLLSDSFDPSVTQSFLRKGYESNIKEGMYFKHFLSLRLVEAKLASIQAFSIECFESGNVIMKLKTINYDPEYNRREVFLKLDGGKLIIGNTSDEKASERFDRGVIYVPYQ
ncbi:MAG: hypothetical protein MI864_18290 [Pseudomonadales bacterium]|nr:hypothetical protein [Pseudomonadales bacterium]